HADAERLLADGEGLASARSLALDHDALEDLGALALALDHLEVHLHAVPRLEGGDLANSALLDAVDDRGHSWDRSVHGAPARVDCAKRRRMVAETRHPAIRLGRDCARAAIRGLSRGLRRAGSREPPSPGTRAGGCIAGTRDAPPARR